MKNPKNRRWLVLAVVLIAECMDLLDSTIVNVAAPAIHNELGTSSSALQWIVSGYSLALAIGLIAGARLGDMFGRRKMFLVGAAGFTIASAACGLAPNTGILIGARLVQGLASAVLLPQGFGLLREAFDVEDLGKAFGIFGPVIGSAAVFGPIIGGGLIALDAFGTGWRLVFFVNVPLGIAAVVGGYLLLPISAAVDRDSRLDLTGVALSALAAFAVVYPLIQGRDLGWPWWTGPMIAGGVALFGVFGLQQRARAGHGKDPLMLTSIFTHRGYSAGSLVLLMFFAGFSGVLLVLSVFLQLGQGFSAIHAGVTMVPMSAGVAVGSLAAGMWLAPRLGRTLIQIGAVVDIAGWALVIHALHGNGATVGMLDLLPGLALVGVGMGFVITPMFDIIITAVTEAETGSASGVLNATQQLAGAIGVAVIGSIFFSAVGHIGMRGATSRTIWITIGSLALVALFTTLLPARAREAEAAALEDASSAGAAVELAASH